MYVIQYDGNGSLSGDVPIDATDYDSGAIVTLVGNTGVLVKTGYTFAGWSLTATGGVITQFEILDNVTVYAHWILGESVWIPFPHLSNLTIDGLLSRRAKQDSTIRFSVTITGDTSALDAVSLYCLDSAGVEATHEASTIDGALYFVDVAFVDVGTIKCYFEASFTNAQSISNRTEMLRVMSNYSV